MLPLWDSLARRRRANVTSALIVVIAAVFFAQVVAHLARLEDWERRFVLVPELWCKGWQTWPGWMPVFSSSLLHGGVAHVAGNLWFLWVFGRSLEEHVGGFRFALIYAFGAAGAALAHIASDPGSTIPVVGASGAISAVMGAYFVLLPTRWIVTLVPWIVPILPVPAVVFLLLWFAMQFAQGMDTLGHQSGGGVAWWAHAGGFVVGAVLAALLAGSKSAPKTKRRESR